MGAMTSAAWGSYVLACLIGIVFVATNYQRTEVSRWQWAAGFLLFVTCGLILWKVYPLK